MWEWRRFPQPLEAFVLNAGELASGQSIGGQRGSPSLWGLVCLVPGSRSERRKGRGCHQGRLWAWIALDPGNLCRFLP